MKSNNVRRPAWYYSLFAVLGVASCDAIIGIEELRSFGDDGNNQSCQVPTDCPTAGNACFLRACNGGVCQVTEAPPGTLTAAQAIGDCKEVVCGEGSQAVSQNQDSDVFLDGNDCTQDLCSGGEPSNPNWPAGQMCVGGVCNGAGQCVECIGTGQCTGGKICKDNQCVLASCNDNTKNNNETDIDCGGGDCPPCGVGKDCEQGTDCNSKVCAGSNGNKTCQAPTCNDGVKNGTESDQDCGGACPLCQDGKKCMATGDCASHVCACPANMPICTEPLCQVPTCSDGVQNGGEVAIDCQGNCQGTCLTNQPCVDAEDCESAVCNNNMCAAPTCSDGVKNGTETGVDCGGSCPACG